MTKEDKVRAIQFLAIRRFSHHQSGDRVSKFFGISKFTLYNYPRRGKI